jgi:PKD repeat protein
MDSVIRNTKIICVVSFFFLLTAVTCLSATTISVNHDSTASSSRFKTFNDALNAINSSHTGNDTIFFTDTAQYTYEMSQYVDNNWSGDLHIINKSNNPDRFPIVDHNRLDMHWNLFNNKNVYFEKVILTGINGFDCQDGTISFKNCVIRNTGNTGSPFVIFRGSDTSSIVFQNCLFNAIKDTLFRFASYSNGYPIVKITNCTFDSCKTIFNQANEYSRDSVSIKNCIFSNTVLISDPDIKTKITNSLFNTDLTGLGFPANCISNGNPSYIKSSRVVPSDWKITSASGAINKGDNNSAPQKDIGNQPRNIGGVADMGCWELQNNPPTAITPAIFSVKEDATVNTVVGILKTTDADISTGDRFTYAFSSGTSDNASFKLIGDTLKVANKLDFEYKPVLSVFVKSTDALGDFIVDTLTVNVLNVNEAPGEINLDNTSISENNVTARVFIGKLTSIDPDDATGFVYRLSGTDSSSFLISNDSLFSNAIFNYEQKKTYLISVTSKDKAGSDSALSFTQPFSISIVNVNEPPTSITLTGSGVKSPGTAGVPVGTFTTIDADSNSTFTYSFVTGDGSINNDLFEIVDNQLRTKNTIPAGDSLSIRVNSSDGQYSFAQKFTIYITTAPVIASQSSSLSVFRGLNAKFSVVATGKELKYQWYKNSAIMTSDTLSSISILNCQRTDSGTVFSCAVSNIAGTVTSLPCTLFVNTKAYFTTQPVSDTISEGDSIVFSVAASGSNTLSYQWFRNDTLISSEISSTIKIKNVLIAADNGDRYTCKVTNIFGYDSSSAAILTVVKAIPKVTVNPLPVTVADGVTAVFTCVSAGSIPVSYFWFSTKSPADTLSKKDTLRLSVVQKADSGTGYYCIVVNSVGKDTSSTATLHVGNVKPIVSTDTPDSVTIYEKTSALITLHSTGTAPLTYKWFKKGVASNEAVGINKDTLILSNVPRTDSGAIYFCIISNSAGEDTSKLTKLIVKKALEKPSFIDAVQLPKILTKYVGDSLKLSVRATGNPLPVYRWIKNDSVITGASDSVLIIPYLTLTYNNAKFFSIVSNTQDTINSDTLTLTVETRPKAIFSFGPSSGSNPLTVAFTDSSTGTIASRLWNFGDGTTSELANPTHQYTVDKRYTVKLKVSGPGGIDSIVKENCIYVYKKGSNPITITGQYLKPSRIILTMTNLSGIDIASPLFKTDSIGIWYKKDSLPSSPLTSIRAKAHIASKLVTYASYKDTINVPVGDSVYGVMTGLYLPNKTISEFSPANGCIVLMRDTMTPVNTLTAIGRHLGGPDVAIDIHNIATIDTMTIDSVAVWYGYDTLKASFSSLPTVWYSSKLLKLQPTGTYTFPLNNQMFLVQKQVWVGVILKAQNKKISIAKFSSFTPGASKANPVLLNVAAINAGTVKLNWPHVMDTSFSKIRIWYGKKAVPLVTNVTDQTFDSTTVQSSTDSLVLQSFTAKTQYHFGAQALVKLAASSYWTEITSKSSGAVTTPAATELFPNKLKFTAPVRYDSVTNTMKVSWKLDSTFAATDTLNVGITYSFDSTQVFDNVTINKNGKFPDSSTITFKVPALQFEKKYWVGLWLTKKGSGYWAPPTKDCLGTCSIPSFTRQVVTYFEPGKDTIFANNGKIRLWTELSDNPTTDTLKINSVASLKGFVVVNPGFYFAKKENTRGFYVGLSYASLPSIYKHSQVRFFRGNNGFASIDTNPPAYDTINKYVYIKTNDLNDPFMLLIDTMPPGVIAPSKTITAAYLKGDIQENFRVSDNINNVKWSYFYSAADGKGKTIEGYFNASLKDTSKAITIPKENVGNETGVRIILKVTDGTYTVTYNLSRRILVTESDGFYLNPQKWTPISTNFELDETRVSELILKKLKSSDNLYDKKYTRIFQWMPTLSNATSADKWVEYGGIDTAQFDLTPGKTIWLKTRLENIPASTGNFVTFSGAKTISLRDTFSLKLKPNSFTDICVPFHFNVRLSDILNATQKNDSLSFFIWQKEGKDSIYNAKAFYLKNVTGANNKDTMIDFQKPLTIMNNSNDTITLRFPPVSYYESPASLSKPNINPQAWSVTVKAASGNSESEVYYGYVPGVKSVLYPDAPTFLQKRITLLERTSQQQGCYMVTGALPNGGFSKEISLVNKSDTTATFTLTAEQNGNFPADYKTVFFNRSSNEFSSGPSVTVAANSTETIWVISATSSYIDNYFNKVMALTYALGSLYPNPCRGVLNIPYVIPFGTSDLISFEIFDELGRLVWKKDLEANHSGMNRLLWDGKGRSGQKLSAGFYLMRFTSRSGSGKVTSQFHSKFTYLP